MYRQSGMVQGRTEDDGGAVPQHVAAIAAMLITKQSRARLVRQRGDIEEELEGSCRQGKWLCKKEVEQLIDLLKIYKAAIMVYERRREMDREVGQLDGDQKDALKMAMKIDTVAEWAPPCWPPSEEELEKYRPCFMSSSKGAEHVEEMVKVLGRRCLPGVDETVYQCQSPIMVGSSGNMSRRTAAHLPNTLMSHTPKAWALMLSCMRVMGINYEVQSAPLFRAWQNEKQVKAAEVLGAVLAGSMVSVAGLNVEQPGLQHSDLKLSQEVFKEGERQVCAMKPWYRENLKLSISRKPENREITDHLERNREELRKLQEREDRGRKDLEKANSENEAAKAPLNSLMTKIRGKLEHGERVLDELKRERDSNRELATGEEAILGEESTLLKVVTVRHNEALQQVDGLPKDDSAERSRRADMDELMARTDLFKGQDNRHKPQKRVTEWRVKSEVRAVHLLIGTILRGLVGDPEISDKGCCRHHYQGQREKCYQISKEADVLGSPAVSLGIFIIVIIVAGVTTNNNNNSSRTLPPPLYLFIFFSSTKMTTFFSNKMTKEEAERRESVLAEVKANTTWTNPGKMIPNMEQMVIMILLTERRLPFISASYLNWKVDQSIWLSCKLKAQFPFPQAPRIYGKPYSISYAKAYFEANSEKTDQKIKRNREDKEQGKEPETPAALNREYHWADPYNTATGEVYVWQASHGSEDASTYRAPFQDRVELYQELVGKAMPYQESCGPFKIKCPFSAFGPEFEACFGAKEKMRDLLIEATKFVGGYESSIVVYAKFHDIHDGDCGVGLFLDWRADTNTNCPAWRRMLYQAWCALLNLLNNQLQGMRKGLMQHLQTYYDEQMRGHLILHKQISAQIQRLDSSNEEDRRATEVVEGTEEAELVAVIRQMKMFVKECGTKKVALRVAMKEGFNDKIEQLFRLAKTRISLSPNGESPYQRQLMIRPTAEEVLGEYVASLLNPRQDRSLRFRLGRCISIVNDAQSPWQKILPMDVRCRIVSDTVWKHQKDSGDKEGLGLVQDALEILDRYNIKDRLTNSTLEDKMSRPSPADSQSSRQTDMEEGDDFLLVKEVKRMASDTQPDKGKKRQKMASD
ncbi:hypothetical protein NPX13_g3601 [Xylaria arbuscula]|uniref:Uncharacterized protein n=1 Tax=Xylaria arbuscula TaxID=114810 RepID=A0A9W8NI60_9PEZI|nr:hypothetical protein NPX13_g3601 [Xylaria arbuscula]